MTDSLFSAPPADFFLRPLLSLIALLPTGVLLPDILPLTTEYSYYHSLSDRLSAATANALLDRQILRTPNWSVATNRGALRRIFHRILYLLSSPLSIYLISNSISLFIPLSPPCQPEWPLLSRSSRPRRLVRRPRLSSNSNSPSLSLILRIRNHRIAVAYLVPNSNKTALRLRRYPRSPLRP